MIKDKWIITDKTFNKNGLITYNMKSVDTVARPDKRLSSLNNKAYVGSYTDSVLNPLSGKYSNKSYDIATVESVTFRNCPEKQELFYLFKFFNPDYGDFYSILPPYHFEHKIFKRGDKVLLGQMQKQDSIPHFAFYKNLTTGEQFNDWEDEDIAEYMEFVVIGDTRCDSQHPSQSFVYKEAVIKSEKFGSFVAEFNMLYTMPLYPTKRGDKVVIKHNTKDDYAILQNLTIDNLRTEYLLSQDVR